MITMGPNPLYWVDDLLDKIVAFQDEVEENICQGPVKYVENQVKTVGVSVKKFCSNVMKDMEHLAHDEVNREQASLGNQLSKKDSFINKVYSEVKKELSEVKKEFSDFVDDVIFENPQTNLSQDETSYKSEVSAEKESSSNQLSKKDSFSEVKNDLVDLADEDISEKSQANSSRIIVDVDSSSTTTTQVKSTTDIDNGSMWSEEDKVNEELSSRSDNIFEQLPGSHTRQNEQAEMNLGVVDNIQEVGFQSETSVPEVDQASDSSEAPVEGTTISSTEDGTETGNTTDETVEIYDHQGMIKLGESCVLVEGTEEGSIPNMPRGHQRSYKKKIRDVVLRRWMRNSNNKHQLYPVVESMEPAGATTSTSIGGSSRPIVGFVKTQSQTEDLPELEWELI